MARILILGGYGGVGKALTECLIKHTSHQLTIAGRNLQKATIFRNRLLEKHPAASLEVSRLDAADRDSLASNFKKVDLAVITATVPDDMILIAKVALETGVDLIDILLRGDVVDQLAKFESQIKQRGRRFITQAGFHPGLITPTIRMARTYFDEYQDAKIFLAMDAIFERPESASEIIYEVIKSDSKILEDGHWRKASYKDALSIDFKHYFGKQSCFPLQMREIYGLDLELGLKNAGVYAAGFGSFADNVIFPLAMILGLFSIKLSQRICSKLLFQSIKKNLGKKPRVEFVLQAKGLKNGHPKQVEITLLSEDGFQLTAIAVVALLQQYFENTPPPGLHLMGQFVKEMPLFQTLQEMGVEIKISIS